MESKIFNGEIGRCESLDEYEELVRSHSELYLEWSDYIGPLLHNANLTAAKVADGCGVSKNCAVQFFHSIPAKRDNVIKLAMMLGFSVDETNVLLTRWAKFQRLYPKHPKDFIWIYLLNHGQSDHPEALFRAYYGCYEQMHEEYLQRTEESERDADALETTIARDLIDENLLQESGTAQERSSRDATLSAEDLCAQDERFAALTTQLLPSFETGYRNLMNYIDALFPDMDRIDNERLGLDELNRKSGRGDSPNGVFKGKWLDLYYRQTRELRHEHKVPSRAFLIALGLRMSMNADQINALLEKAGMAPLCPKDRLEGTIFFCLEELYCNFPTYFLPSALEVDLMDYSSQHDGTLPKYIELDEDEYPTETLSEYIGRRLEETNIFDVSEQERMRKFLKFLRDD